MTRPLDPCRQIRRRVFVPIMMALLALLVVLCLAVVTERNRLALIDTTESTAALGKFLAILVGSTVSIAGLLGWLFWRYLGWVQVQVTQAQKDLAMGVERERRFTDDVAHELRTPLAGMRSTIDVALRADREADELRESLEDCSSILGEMESRVDKLLMLARLDGKRVVFDKETIALSELIGDCWEPLKGHAVARGLTFENRVPNGLECISDRGSLAIILSNLLENSVHYADVSGRIWVTAESISERAVRLAVANTGCRLKAAEVALAFGQFWRGDQGRGCNGRHAGLGLPLVCRLAAALGAEASGEVDEDGVFTVGIVLERAPRREDSLVHVRKTGAERTPLPQSSYPTEKAGIGLPWECAASSPIQAESDGRRSPNGGKARGPARPSLGPKRGEFAVSGSVSGRGVSDLEVKKGDSEAENLSESSPWDETEEGL